MKATIGVLTTLATFAVLSTSLFGQGATSPSQPQDPTAQAPATPPQSTPPTFPKSAGEAKSPDRESTPRPSTRQPFRGTVILRGDTYSLRAGDLEYNLEPPATVKRYVGQSVKIVGTLDKPSNTIHVETIKKESPPS